MSCVGDGRGAYKALLRKTVSMITLGRTSPKWKSIIMMDLQEI
jgi:hypothetical protein